MENKLANHQFVEFAEQRLKEHLAELKTRYQGREMASESEKTTAISKHIKIFTAELEEKAKEVGENGDFQKSIKEYQEKLKNSLD